MSTTTVTRPVGVDELRRAWRALQDGQFRGRHQGAPSRHRTTRRTDLGWAPTESVVPVVGCVGRAGASTLALAIAAAAGDARVIECCSATASGLSTAATAELGTSPNGWTLGRRDKVSIARTIRVYLSAGELPTPDDPPAGSSLTVLDVGWELGQVLGTSGWLSEHLAHAQRVIAVTSATIPGLRRLETALTLLGPARVLIAAVGTPRRRWPRHLSAALGPQATTSDRAGRLVCVPTDRQLALRGVDSTPLPTSLLHAAEALLRHTCAADQYLKGQPS